MDLVEPDLVPPLVVLLNVVQVEAVEAQVELEVLIQVIKMVAPVEQE
jgi:hypothetical protein